MKDEAFKVLEALTSPEAQQWVLERGLALPSRAALVDNPYFAQDDREAQANLVVFKGRRRRLRVSVQVPRTTAATGWRPSTTPWARCCWASWTPTRRWPKRSSALDALTGR